MLPSLVLLVAVASGSADEEFAPLARNLAALEKAGLSLPSEATQALKKRDIDALHDALAGQVFLSVTINPEGRVKVARGKSVPRLRQGIPALALIKVENLSGATQLLEARGAYTGAKAGPFQIQVLSGELKGLPVEYRLARVTCSQAGKRELTIAFQAGQGTQDIGFRGEVPVLFDVGR
jgi:hypothetical protein